MAKLCVSYILCPLIDQKSLLGVSEDSENGNVVVTLGKNMVVRYKLKGQKQISSWSSDFKFTAQVIFDGESKEYASVLGQNYVRLWQETEQSLENAKKYKFGKAIHCLLPRPDGKPSLVVFCDGTFAPLSEALAKRKVQESNKHLPMQDCKIVTDHGKEYIVYQTVTATETYFHTVAIDSGEETSFLLSRESLALRGHAVMEDEGKCTLYSLWSDGKLYSMRLFSSETAPGIPVHTITEITLKFGVAMVALSGCHLAIYGADVSEEGAILMILNTQFYFVQARQLWKLFGIAPRLWKIDSNLFLASGNFLTVVPYKLEIAKLAAVVGSHAPDAEKITRAVWGETMNQPIEIDAPPSIVRHLKALSNYGWSQSTIASKLFPKLLKEEEYDAIIWVLQNYDDISEANLVTLLEHCLAENDLAFEVTKEDVAKEGMEVDTNVKPQGKVALVDAILQCPFADVALLPHLRAISFPNTLTLLTYLSEKLAASTDARYSDWMGLMLDSHYHDFLLSKDPMVLKKLNELRYVVDGEIWAVENLRAMAPAIQRLLNNKSIQQRSIANNYSIVDASFVW